VNAAVIAGKVLGINRSDHNLGSHRGAVRLLASSSRAVLATNVWHISPQWKDQHSWSVTSDTTRHMAENTVSIQFIPLQEDLTLGLRSHLSSFGRQTAHLLEW
jgi:hypothetical protein